MKLLFTTTIILLSVLVQSQSPYQIADTSKVWNTITIGFGSWGVWLCGGTKSNKFEGEIFIGGNTYLEVLESEDSLQENWYVNGFLREDTINNSVYFGWGVGEIGLIYDFDLNVGDSIYIDNYYTTYTSLLVCDSIDTVNINGVFKNRYFFSSDFFNPNYPAEVWIEGIGSVFGVLNSGLGGVPLGGGTRELLCCSENDEVIYMDSLFGACFIDEFFPQIISETYDTAYLNTYYEFQLQIDTFNVDSFALIGNVIPESFNFNESTGLITGMPTETGTFPCIITIKNYDLGGCLTDMLDAHISVVLPTTIHQQSQQPDMKIYPNPFNTIFYVEVENHNKKTYFLEILSAEGVLIDKKTIRGSLFKFDSGKYKNGLYLFKLSGNNIIKIKKCLKK